MNHHSTIAGDYSYLHLPLALRLQLVSELILSVARDHERVHLSEDQIAYLLARVDPAILSAEPPGRERQLTEQVDVGFEDDYFLLPPTHRILVAQKLLGGVQAQMRAAMDRPQLATTHRIDRSFEDDTTRPLSWETICRNARERIELAAFCAMEATGSPSTQREVVYRHIADNDPEYFVGKSAEHVLYDLGLASLNRVSDRM